MACGESNGHVTDDVTCHVIKVKLVTAIRLEPNMSKRLDF